MKKFILGLLLFFLIINLKAQNIQLHYDLGKDRSYLTSTVEMFRPDKYGSTFFFIDMDYGVGDVEGVSLAYFEISRAIKLGDIPIAAHIEYNGGFGQWQDDGFGIGGAYTINDAWLGGFEYSLNNRDYSKGITLQFLYKNIREKTNLSFQVTAVWYLNSRDKAFTFCGFADFWQEENTFGLESADYVFLSEPQFWYNVDKHFSLGSEIELSSNFAGLKGFHVMPTVAAKYTF